MGVRKIGVKTRSMTGRNGYSGQEFESTLERDLLDLLEFDYMVDRYEVQPLTITYENKQGRTCTYTPDVLVTYRRDLAESKNLPHQLYEVKYRADYREKFSELKDRLKAARRFAKEKEWEFKVLTEREIRTPYLWNAQFLLPYRDIEFDADMTVKILGQVRKLGDTSPEAVIESLANNDYMRASYLRELWYLVATKQVDTDLMLQLSMQSRIWHRRQG